MSESLRWRDNASLDRRSKLARVLLISVLTSVNLNLSKDFWFFVFAHMVVDYSERGSWLLVSVSF